MSPFALSLLDEWLHAARIGSGPLFRSIKGGTVASSSLHPHSIGVIIKRAARTAGLSSTEIQQLSGHSMRVGAAQDMVCMGLDLLPIMAAGGWKTTNIVARYIENANLTPLLSRFHSP